MEREHIPVYLPAPLIAKVDQVASSEMRSRTNAVTWLVSQALKDREPVEQPVEVS